MKTPAKAHALSSPLPPLYPTGLQAFAGALWQRLRWRTWRAFAPADDRGIERSHADAEDPSPLEQLERLQP